MKKRITVDLDGVVADLVTPLLSLVAKRYDLHYRFEDVRHYQLERVMPSLSADDVLTMVEETISEKHFQIPAVPGAVSTLQQLSHSYELAIITSRKDIWRVPTEHWIQRELPAIPLETFFTTTADGNVLNGHKSTILRDLGSVLHLEDGLHFAKEVAEQGIPVILFDQPWNQRHRPCHGIHRIGSYREKDHWNKVPSLIEDLTQNLNSPL